MRTAPAALVGLVLLLWPPLSDRVGWWAWLACAAAGSAAGLAAAALSQHGSFGGFAAVIALIFVPSGALATVEARWGFIYLIASGMGALAGRRTFPYRPADDQLLLVLKDRWSLQLS